MKIAIDISQTAFAGTGVARYTKNLVKSLLSNESPHVFTFFYSSLRQPLDPEIASLIKSPHCVKKYRFPPSLLEFIWNVLHILPIEILIGRHDLFISSDWTEPPSSMKKITILHDLIVYKFPNTTHAKTDINISSISVSPDIVKIQKRKLNWVKKESQIIICDSESTKKDAEKFLAIPEKKLFIVYPGIELLTITPEEIKRVMNKYHIQKKFILSVGKIEPRKNIKNLIEAFKKTQITDLELLIVGPIGWEEEQIMNKQPHVRFLGFIPDKDLYALYANALFFMYPSLYEGFGLPIVEAMSFGCPIGSSNTSSMKEITNGYGLIFDPNDINSIQETITKIYSDNNLRKELSEKSLQRAKDFSQRKFRDNWMKIFSIMDAK